MLDRVELETDVLVVGGGLAALKAALTARQAGAAVVVAVKGKLGRSGSSAMTSAGYSSAVLAADSPVSHLHDTLVGGRSINDEELVEVMTREAPRRLEELVALGGELAMDGSEPVVHPSGDHSTARTVVAANFKGLDFTLPLAQAVREAGCVVLEQTMVSEVLVEDGAVAGAICVSTSEAGALVVVAAPSVLLAAGGCGQLFRVTSNPSDVTGDGYALALRAGARLRDMEFIQFYPWRCIVPFGRTRMPIQPSTFVLGAKLYNSAGERFMTAYDPERHEATTRDVAARGIYDQIRTGKAISGGVRLDLTDLSDDDWRRTNVRPSEYFDRRGIDFRGVEMILAPEAHFCMGGVATDAAGRSSVAGLFAAGENAGGVHGANRLDSNAIPETQVFGARAGAEAARHALVAGRSAPSSVAVSRWLDEHARDFGRGEGAADGEVLAALQETAWEKLGIVRDERRLEEGLAAIGDYAATLEAAPAPRGAPAIVARLELRNLIEVARVCFTAALDRTESRGAHYRLDFPLQDDERWGRSLLVNRRVDGSIELRRADSAMRAGAIANG